MMFQPSSAVHRVTVRSHCLWSGSPGFCPFVKRQYQTLTPGTMDNLSPLPFLLGGWTHDDNSLDKTQFLKRYRMVSRNQPG